MNWKGEIANVPEADVAHYLAQGAELQSDRRQRIEAARAGHEAEARGYRDRANRELMAEIGGTAASLLIPGGPALRAGSSLAKALAARAALGSLGGATGGGIHAAISGDDIAPAAARGALVGAVGGPLMAGAGKLVGAAGSRAAKLSGRGGRTAGEALSGAGAGAALGGVDAAIGGGDVVGGMRRGALVGAFGGPLLARGGRQTRGADHPAPATAPAATLSPADRLKSMRPPRANASAETKRAARVELELAMDEAKLSASARKAMRETLGYEATKGSAASRAKMRVVEGKSSEPAVPKPNPAMKPVKGSAESQAPKAQEREVYARPMPKREAHNSRHDVQYYSESRGKYINIEDMNQAHIEHAYRKLVAKHPKSGSLGRKVLNALMAESKQRLQTTGIHVGHAR